MSNKCKVCSSPLIVLEFYPDDPVNDPETGEQLYVLDIMMEYCPICGVGHESKLNRFNGQGYVRTGIIDINCPIAPNKKELNFLGNVQTEHLE